MHFYNFILSSGWRFHDCTNSWLNDNLPCDFNPKYKKQTIERRLPGIGNLKNALKLLKYNRNTDISILKSTKKVRPTVSFFQWRSGKYYLNSNIWLSAIEPKKNFNIYCIATHTKDKKLSKKSI